ncbi:MAG: hypothetical protein RIR21_63 [Pseudomonadota bacterium]|jgi:hypothetical protein
MMNKKVSITLLLLLVPALVLTHVSWSQKENGLMFNVDGREVDFVGIFKNKWRMATNSCKTVTELKSEDHKFSMIKAAIQSYSPPDSIPIKVIYVWTSGTWAVAEVEFENLLPAVVVINNLDASATVVADAIWSGTTAPWKSGPFIRAYLGQKASDMPDALLNCFELQTSSFK